jgi:glycosyltransferase involved in cell wall biosynthesis
LEAAGVVHNPRVLKAVEGLVRWIYKHCDRILMTSKGFSSEIAKLGVPSKKLIYWPQWAENVFSKKALSLEYKDERLPTTGFVFTFAGNIGSSQDFETIVQSAILLKDRQDIHFVILGDGLMKKWAEAQVQAHQLERTFHLLGQKPVETMPYYFSRSSVLLVTLTDSPLFAITVPAKIQTYLASGKPILAALNGEGAKLIEDWNAGRTCKASSPQQLAQTMIELSELPAEHLAEMGKNALTCYRSEFEREKLIDALEVQFETARKEFHE